MVQLNNGLKINHPFFFTLLKTLSVNDPNTVLIISTHFLIVMKQEMK